MGAVFEVDNGKYVRFWEDVWNGDVPLKTAFPSLYDLSNNKSKVVRDVYDGENWNITFRRTLGTHDLELWEELMDRLEEVQLNEEPDKVRWALEKSGEFTTKSMYRWLLHRGVVNKRLRGVWKSKLPMKLKVFLWQIFHDKLQTGAELKKRKWRGSEKCNLCGKLETVDHIFFSCVLAKFVWACFKEALGWERVPTSWQDFLDIWILLGCRDYNPKLFLSTIVL